MSSRRYAIYSIYRDSVAEVGLEFEVDNEVVRCLVDTGAAVTLLNKNEIVVQGRTVQKSDIC